MFRISLSPKASKVFARLSRKLQQKFSDELGLLAKNPFAHRHQKKIRGEKFAYRLRFGRWRILFAAFRKEKRIEVVDIFLRKEKDDYGKRKFF